MKYMSTFDVTNLFSRVLGLVVMMDLMLLQFYLIKIQTMGLV